MQLINYLNIGGLFTFPVNLLTKNESTINYTKYKRNKGIPKSTRPMYNSNRIKLNKKGNKFALTNFLAELPSISDNIYQVPVIEIPDVIGNIILQNNKDLYSDILKFKSLLDIKNEQAESYDDTEEESYSLLNTENNLKGMSLLELIKQEGLPIKITSAYRPNSKTKSGHTSYHSVKDEYGNPQAYDIQPCFNGTVDNSKEGFLKLTQILLSNDTVKNWFKVNGFGILDETYSEIMKKTGATGPHFHIGKDQIALKGYLRLIDNYNT